MWRETACPPGAEGGEGKGGDAAGAAMGQGGAGPHQESAAGLLQPMLQRLLAPVHAPAAPGLRPQVRALVAGVGAEGGDRGRAPYVVAHGPGQRGAPGAQVSEQGGGAALKAAQAAPGAQRPAAAAAEGGGRGSAVVVWPGEHGQHRGAMRAGGGQAPHAAGGGELDLHVIQSVNGCDKVWPMNVYRV